jgi:hypothetical protein
MRGLGAVFYGGEGVGKTSFAAQWAKLGPVKFISPGETGFEDLVMVGDIPSGCTNVTVNTFEALDKECSNVKEKTLVIDGLLELQTLIFDYVCRKHYDGVWEGKDGFTSFFRGQRVDSPPYCIKLLDKLNMLLNEGKNVLLLGHVFTITLPNTLGADFLSHVVALDDGDKGGMRTVLMHWAPNVIFMNIDIAISRATETERRIVMEGKAKDSDNRLMYTMKSPGHAAKNRLKLPPVIPMGGSAEEAFQNFYNKLPQNIQDNL